MVARRAKATVDYFPHDCNHGKTIFILESRYGNDGYATWFKILEQLGSSSGHFIDLRNTAEIIHTAARCRVSPDTLIDILDTIAELDAIDQDLWHQKVVFSSGLVGRITDAYRRRINDLPSKEKVSAVINAVCVVNMTAEMGILPEEMTQRERERERERERKDKPSSSSSSEISPAAEETTELLMTKMTRREFSTLYFETFGTIMPGMLNHDSEQCCGRYPPDKIREAFRISAEKGAKSWSYTKAVLEGKGKQMNDSLAYLDELETTT